MKICWSAESVTDGMRSAQGAKDALSECLARSSEVRLAIEDALPGEESKALKAFLEIFDEARDILRREDGQLDQLVRGMRYTIDHFEDAEASIMRLSEGLEEGGQTEAFGTPQGTVSWMPDPVILPGGYGRERIVMDWLDELIKDPSLFSDWT